MWYVVIDGPLKILKPNTAIVVTDGWETLNEFDECFSSLINELAALGKEYGNREIALKVMRALPREWDVKTMAMRVSKDLNNGEEPSSNLSTKDLAATTTATTSSTAAVVVLLQALPAVIIDSTSEKTAEQISSDAMSLFVKKFSRFMKKNHRAYQGPNRNFKKDSPSVKTENQNLKDQISKFACLQENSCNDLKVEINRLRTENDRMNTDYQTLKSENQRLSVLVNAWNKSSVSLENMQELQKQSGDRSGLGFSNNESTSGNSTKPELDTSKEKYIRFIKSSLVYEPEVPTVRVERNVEYITSMRSGNCNNAKDVTGRQANTVIGTRNKLDFSFNVIYIAALKATIMNVIEVKRQKKLINFFLDKDEDAITAIINDSSETALHVAVETGKSNDFLRKLLEYPMPNEAMLSKDSTGDTALHTAALAGNKEAAILLVNKKIDLLYITNNNNMLPIHLAARNSQKDTLMYLISVSKKEVQNSPFVGKLGASLLTIAIASEFIDVALYLVQKYPELATLSDDDDDYALQVIAGMKSVFPSGKSFNWWQNWIYSCVPLTSLKNTRITTGPRSDMDQVTKKFDWFNIISFVVPEVKSIKKKKVMHRQTLELVKCLCTALQSLSCSDASPIYESAIVKAARKGIHEVVEVIIEMFPNAIYAEESKTECSIFHIAARERVENIFNLIYHMNERKQYFYDMTDSSGNNFMHICGELAPPHKLNLVSGAALQMQRELQWSKEMENFVNPSRRTWFNNDRKTPQMLFSEKHQELKSQGEKWMKDTATSCTIAAALIATVVFAAAFTVPGGLHGDTGVPIFVRKNLFVLFAISDSVSLFTSTTSLLMFLSILTSRYAEQDFLYLLPKRLCIGLLTLFTSITFMMVAFSAAIYITLKEKSNLFLVPMTVLACLPVTSFALLQFPLLIDVMYCTYGPGIFGKKSDRTLY
ncbi:uncharacterized protein LOC142535003 [Primulina tabacum]|uniref:uncharacterized protein LOC142535003 n=2 Tax=Primulina tabacum TaxID=48773 RepID=UPI003F599D42